MVGSTTPPTCCCVVKSFFLLCFDFSPFFYWALLPKRSSSSLICFSCCFTWICSCQARRKTAFLPLSFSMLSFCSLINTSPALASSSNSSLLSTSFLSSPLKRLSSICSSKLSSCSPFFLQYNVLVKSCVSISSSGPKCVLSLCLKYCWSCSLRALFSSIC